MEEILASIKRIIADDGLALKGAPITGRSRPRAGSPPPATEPVLELTEAVAPAAATPPAPPVAPAAATAPAAPAPEAVAHAPLPTPAPMPAPTATATDAVPPATLVSDDAACASRQSLSNLSSLVLRTPENDNTLDGLVRELLRPMLKEWLDARLPDLVETLVAREIARITGKAL